MARAGCTNCHEVITIHPAEAAGILTGGMISKTCPNCEQRAEFVAPIDLPEDADGSA